MSPLSLPTKAVTADSKVEIAEDSSEQLSRYRRSAAAFSRTEAESAMTKMDVKISNDGERAESV